MRALILLSLFIAAPALAADRVDLFDRKTLQGWRQHNGTATCRDVDGAIVGKTSEGRLNPFLCTTRVYGDFEMESDVKVHDRLNTGVMIRAREREKTVGEGRNNHRGRVCGPNPKSKLAVRRAPKPAISSRGRQPRLAHPEERLIPHKRLRDSEWNHYRIVANGPRIQTWTL